MYIWGSKKKPNSIIITDDQEDGLQNDGTELAVTQNLDAALSLLRHRQFARVLWVDAICIDQANKKEKEHQIQFMPAIYARARSVLVWLGEAQDDSDRVLELIWAAGERPAAQNAEYASCFLEPSHDQ